MNEEGGKQTINPIEWTGGNEEFTVKITDEEITNLKDAMSEQYLSRFGGDDTQSLHQFQAARMRNYDMRKRIVKDGSTPKYFTGDKVVITADHATWFCGACLSLVKCLWVITPLYRYFVQEKNTLMLYLMLYQPPTQTSMTKNTLEDLTGCLYYSGADALTASH